MMRCGRILLVLLGSIAIVSPARASDKLPTKPKPSTAEAPDPSTEPIADTPAAPAPPPAPSPPPPKAAMQPDLPPPPEPAPLVRAPGGTALPNYPFVLFFEWDSALLSAGAADVLDNVADRYRRIGGKISVAGFADRSGSGGYNRDLSQRRVEVVRAYLASKDIPASAISTQAYGEAKPIIDTADGMREPQNRRVEVTVSASAVSAR